MQALFQGKNYRVRREGKNRYEFRSPYTLQLGTAAEIEKLISDQMTGARKSAIELAAARQMLKQAAAQEGPVASAVPASPVAIAAPPTPPVAPAPTRAPAPRRTPKPHHVAVIPLGDGKKPKRMPNGLGYLRALMAQESSQNVR